MYLRPGSTPRRLPVRRRCHVSRRPILLIPGDYVLNTAGLRLAALSAARARTGEVIAAKARQMGFEARAEAILAAAPPVLRPERPVRDWEQREYRRPRRRR